MANGLAITSEQVAFGYLLRQPLNGFPIVGCRSETHLRKKVAALDIVLTERDLQWLDLQRAER